MIFKMFLFSFYAHFLPNPWYPGEVVETPFRYSMLVYIEAQKYDDVTPEEVMGIYIGEHGSRGRRVKSTSIGDNGKSYGISQIGYDELKQYNEEMGTRYKLECRKDKDGVKKKASCVDMLDWMAHTRVAVWLVHRHKRQHATKGYCIECTPNLAGKGYCRSEEIDTGDDTGPRQYTYIKPQHTWVAHWKCGPKLREFRPGCEKRRIKWMKHLAKWRDNWAYRALDSPKTDEQVAEGN